MNRHGTEWTIFHRASTRSTNVDARAGKAGDVFTADFQTAGRGRLDHKWQSPPGTNLLMSAVLDVGGLSPEAVCTLPLVVGLAVLKAVRHFVSTYDVKLKWPNDVLVDGRKIAGILCERKDDLVIAGIGVNVRHQLFPSELAARATSLAACLNGDRPSQEGDRPHLDGDRPLENGDRPLVEGDCPPVEEVRDRVLDELAKAFEIFRDVGFSALYQELSAFDYLKGRSLVVRQTDDDHEPVCGRCGGIQPNGTLLVGDTNVYAGEAHVLLGAERLADRFRDERDHLIEREIG